ncbi:MAG: lamin tail domain-containing protein [bacterium]
MLRKHFFRKGRGIGTAGIALDALFCCQALIAPVASAQIVLSEIMYNPIGGNTAEFVELHNAGTNAVDVGGWAFTDGITYTFPAPSVIGAGAYLVVAGDRAAFGALYPDVTNLAAGVYSGQLSNQGEKLALADALSVPVFSVTYNNKAPWPLAAAGLGSSLVLVDPYAPADNPGNWVASAQLNGSPGGPDAFFVRDVVINEVLAHTDPPQEDAIELRNLTTNAISVAGWYLSDDNALRKKYRFPAGRTLPPLGYLVVYQQQLMTNLQQTVTNALIPFALSSKGDALYLSEANGAGEIIRYVDQYTYDASQNGFTFGRYPDGTGEFVTLATPTFGVGQPASLEQFRTGTGARNAGPKAGPVVINEIMYHPSVSNNPGRMPAEYVELLNVSASPVPLYNVETPTNTWSLTGGIDYTFSTNLTLLPGQFLLIVGTNDVAGFRQSYGLTNTLVIVGPFANNLGNAGDTVRLRAPNNLELPANTVARYVADEVQYKDQLPWPLAADGLGGSLERTDPLAFGNTAGNWHSVPGVATPGATNSVFVPPGAILISELMAVNRSTLRDEDGEFSDWIELCNTTGHAVSLKGWHLTDQADVPTLWTFPDVSIPARGQLVVFASQKNRTDPLSPLHTNFALDAAGEYLALFRDSLTLEYAFDPAYPPQSADVSYGIEAVGARTATPVQAGSAGRYLVPTNAAQLASNWNAKTFNDAGWKTAGNGIGYDNEATYRPYFQTDLNAEMYNKQGSAFVRYPFVLDSSASVAQILLRLKFEDGVAVWLNGTLVASNNVSAAALAWNSTGVANRDDPLALDFLDFNLNAFTYLLADGTNVLAMQVINTSLGSSDLLLLSELQLLWAASTATVSYVSGYLAPATPGSVNGTVTPGVMPAPALSHPGGVFTGTLSVTVTCANAQAAIRYTLDGSEPTTNSPLYSVPLAFTTETELITRAFAPGLIPSPVTGATYRRTFLGINEILADNVAATPEINDFTDFGDWIELYNGGASAVDLSGYYLSDNLQSPFRWRIPDGATIPARGHLLFWADGYDSKPGLSLTRTFWPNYGFVTRSYHTNFKLAATGEEVGLFSPHGTRVDGVVYGPDMTNRWYGEKAEDWQQGDLSLGRYPDGGATWGYFGEPTAGTTNRLPQLAQNLYRAPMVTVSPAEPLFVTGPVTVTLSAGPGVTAIRYTLDSSQPNSSSLLYTNALTVTSNTVVRARAFANGLHPSMVTTRTFLVNQRKPDLPVVSFVIDPLLLYDNVYGIFKNNLKEREVPGSIQFCTTPTNTAFQIDAGFRMFSLNTFLKAQKPLTVYLAGKYGTAEIGYQLFPEKPIGRFDRFVLRNGCDDWAYAYFRDGLAAKIFEGQIHNALQGYRPTASYLNGKYYGLFNIREKLDEMYFVKNYGVPLADIDYFEMDGGGTGATPLITSGSAASWLALMDFLSTHSLADPANYAYVRTQVDVEDLMDFVIAESFVANFNAWFWNRKWWRDRGPEGRWRWCFFDLDYAFRGDVNQNVLADMAANMEIFRELLDNQEFRTYFAQRFAAHVNSTFNPDRVIPIIDREAARIRNEMTYHVALYGTQDGIPSVAAWETQVEEIRSFARARPAVVLQQLATMFGSGATAQVSVQVPSGGGRSLANYVPLNRDAANVFIAGVPLQLEAHPDIGQSFVRWEITGNQIAATTFFAAGSVWRYNDAVTNDIPGWSGPGFNDSAWPSGAAQLGYGDGDEATTISYGSDSNNKRITYCFRKAVAVTNASLLSSLEVGLLRDDGAVVYINGREVLRSNMPGGVITRTTTASANIEDNNYYVYSLSPTNVTEGTNIVAVEVHQSGGGSSDVSFDMYLTGVRNLSSSTQTNYNKQITITPASGLVVHAVFAPTGESLLPSVVSGTLTLTAAGSPWLATGDVYVPSNTCLAVGPGVTIKMPDGASIYVQGELRMTGTAAAPVYIGPNTNDSARARVYVNPALARAADLVPFWGGISFDRADHPGYLSNVVIRGATLIAAEPVKMIAAVSASRTDMVLHGLDVDDSQLPVIIWDCDSFVLVKSRLHITVIGDALKVTRVAHTRIENCDMYCGLDIIDTDAIDFGDLPGDCIVRNNYFHDFMGPNNDGFDLGEGALGILLESNLIERCFDKGISCGGGSTVTLRHNVIRDVDMGIGVKDAGSHALAENNTFQNLSHAVSAYEKVIGRGGASATVRNCIVSQARVSPFYNDPYSTVDVSYTLSDTDPVPGTGNVVGDPLFLNADTGNYNLQTGSPAIDSGAPGSAADPDGSRADMGAFAFDWRAGHAVLSEIHYHPAVAGQAEYVELTNPGGAPLDLTGYSFAKGFTYAFPGGTVLNPGAYLVIASSPSVPYGAPALVWTAGTLDNAGETVQLIDAVSNEIDRVAYKPAAPWPTEPDGQGSALALISPRWNNALPTSWRASALPGGTPGGPELAAHDTPTWWLAQLGAVNSFDAAATDDWDLDGMPNWAEYVAGTQPTNVNSVLQVDIAALGNSPVAACPTIPAGAEYGGKQRYYSLEGRTNLVTGTWLDIAGYTDILGTGQTILYTNPPSGTGFVRAKATLR